MALDLYDQDEEVCECGHRESEQCDCPDDCWQGNTVSDYVF